MVRSELHQKRPSLDALSRPTRPHLDAIAWRRRMDAETDAAVAALRAVLERAAAAAPPERRPKAA